MSSIEEEETALNAGAKRTLSTLLNAMGIVLTKTSLVGISTEIKDWTSSQDLQDLLRGAQQAIISYDQLRNTVSNLKVLISDKDIRITNQDAFLKHVKTQIENQTFTIKTLQNKTRQPIETFELDGVENKYVLRHDRGDYLGISPKKKKAEVWEPSFYIRVPSIKTAVKFRSRGRALYIGAHMANNRKEYSSILNAHRFNVFRITLVEED
jgi:hypothetical protein